MSKRQKIIWIIDVLTIVFILIALQSGVVRFEKFSVSRPLIERISLSIQLYSVNGWSGVLYHYLGLVVPLSKFLLFIANIYAVIQKAIGKFKRDISPTSKWLIIVNLLFITLRLIEFAGVWESWMGI